MKSLEARLRELDRAAQLDRIKVRDNEREYLATLDAVINGSATMDQYRPVLRREAKAELRLWTPTVHLSQSARVLGIDPGHRFPEVASRYFIGDVLGYHPDEALPPSILEILANYRDIVESNSGDPDERIEAALCLLVLGSKGSGRHVAWKRAATHRDKICDHEVWVNAGLLNVWPEVERGLAERAGMAPEVDKKMMTTYSGLEPVLEEMFG